MSNDPQINSFLEPRLKMKRLIINLNLIVDLLCVINKNQTIAYTSSQFQNQANMNTNIDNNKNINISTKKEVKKRGKKRN